LIGTVAENVLQHGTGAINVDGGRVGTEGGGTHCNNRDANGKCLGHDNAGRSTSGETFHAEDSSGGRWPANFIHDGSEEVVGLFPDTKSGKMGPWNNRTTNGSPNGIYGKFDEEHPLSETYGDSGSAARFFYCAKASKADRDEGCDKLQERSAGECVDRVEGSAGMESPRAGAGRTSGSRNHHPTVKPTDLMRYLCRLVTPPSGIVLDPFMGSGSTGKAAMLEGFAFVGIEREAEYVEIAKARIEAVKNLF
jgi:site-specific DNA-methyltransferase (adenine-specific)